MEGVIPRSSASSVQKVQLSAHLSQVEGPKGKAAKSKAKVKAEKPRPDDMRGLGPQVGDGATSPARAACKEEVQGRSPGSKCEVSAQAGEKCREPKEPKQKSLNSYVPSAESCLIWTRTGESKRKWRVLFQCAHLSFATDAAANRNSLMCSCRISRSLMASCSLLSSSCGLWFLSCRS